MECKGAEVTSAEAASVMGNGEFNLAYRGDTAVLFVHWVIVTHEGKRVNAVKLFSLKGRHGRVYNNGAVAVVLDYRLAVYRIVVSVLTAECLGIYLAVFLQLVVIVAGSGVILACSVNGEVSLNSALHLANVCSTAHVAELFHGDSAVKKLCKSYDGVFTHAVHQNIGAGVDEYASSHLVGPIVVMSKASKGCLKSADKDRYVAVSLADTVTVYDERAVGAFACHSSGGVVVIVPLALCGCIMSHHGVYISRGHEKAKSRSAEALEIVGILPIGLSKNSAQKACLLKHTGNNSRAE